MIRRIHLATRMCFAVSISLVLAGTASSEVDLRALNAARERVFAFEAPLTRGQSAVKSNRPAPSEEDGRAIRRFFENLDGPAMKLAAIEMLDRRYVYVVSVATSADLLGPLLRDSDPQVRVRAARAVGSIGCGKRYAAELIALLEGQPSPETLTAVAYGMTGSKDSEFVPHLVPLLRHADPLVRAEVANALTALDPANSIERNLGLLQDPSPTVRIAAVQNLSHVRGRPPVVKTIESLLRDPDERVRERSLWALGQLQDAGSADAVSVKLKDEHAGVRGRAAETLGLLHAMHFADAIAELLDDPDVVPRRYAAKALGQLDLEPRHQQRLQRATRDPDEQVRQNAAESLRRPLNK